MLVVDFIDGRTWGSADILDPANAERIAQVCQMLHSGPTFGNDFNMLELQRQYLADRRRAGISAPRPVRGVRRPRPGDR